MNVLISCAGRRTSLVAAFKDAVVDLSGRVFTSDVDPLAPAHSVGDGAIRVPPLTDDGYLDVLASIVEDYEIEMVVPTIDTELPLLAAAESRFRQFGCALVVSQPELVEVASDKVLTTDAWSSMGVKCPPTWAADELPEDLPHALVVKPRRGSASEGVRFCSADAVQEEIDSSDVEVVVQEFIDGPEITIDALLAFDGGAVHCVPRRRLRTLAGESIQGVTIDSSPIESWLRTMLESIGTLGGRGPVTIQAILAATGPVLIEVNPRFGGGFPLSYAAGARYPQWLVEHAAGRDVPLELFEYQVGLYMTRAHREYFTRELPW